MKQIQFTIEETELILPLLKERIALYTEDVRRASLEGRKSIYTSVLDSLIATSAKVGTYAAIPYTNKDKLMVVSCCNPACEDLYKKVMLQDTLDWLDISEQQRAALAQCELYEDILLKCDFYREKKHSIEQERPRNYGQTLCMVESIKQSNKIFLSKAGEDDYDKIAFVTPDEKYVEIELKNRVYVRRMAAAPLLEETPSKFGISTDKVGAMQMLATCDEQSYPSGTLDFVRALLSCSN